MSSNPSQTQNSYFKRGARIKPELRRVVTEANVLPHIPRDGDAYQLAISNLHKSWARRWLKANGYGV